MTEPSCVELSRARPLDHTLLRERDYFSSLLDAGRACGRLSDDDLSRIQAETLTLLAQVTEAYTRGQSSSVRVETAQELLHSVFYVIGIPLHAIPTPDEALETAKHTPLSALYDDGQARIRRRLQAARLLHRQIVSELFETPNVFYRATLVDGIAGFFKLYRPGFAAHETPITADYPLCQPLPDATGLCFIETYLRAAFYENRFCRQFPAARIHRLLYAQNPDYPQAVMNLFEPVLTAALGCVLTGEPARELGVDAAALTARLDGKSADETTVMLTSAAAMLAERLDCSTGLCAYIRRCVPSIAAALVRASQNGTLSAIFAPAARALSSIYFERGKRMSDRAYTRVLAAVAACADIAEAASVITSEIHALDDLFDLLRDMERSVADRAALFAHFPPEVLAALAAHYPHNDFLTDERERAVYAALHRHLDTLPASERERVEALAQQIVLSTS